MNTQNTTSNNAVSFISTITPVAGMSLGSAALPVVAANEKWLDTGTQHPELADEVPYWMIVGTAVVFALMLLNLVTAI